MNIIVAGCGKIGTKIISDLVSEGHEVVAVDNSERAINEVSDVYDIMCVSGNATDCEVLSEANAEKADIYIAVLGSDEMNILSCFIAKRMGVKHTLARIRNPQYSQNSLAFLKAQFELSLSLNPEKRCANEIYNILRFPNAVGIETFSERTFGMFELILKPETNLYGMSLAALRQSSDAKFLVCTVKRNDKIYIPYGDFVLQPNDKIGIIAETGELGKMLRSFGLLRKQAKSVMILGGSRIAVYLAKELLSSGCQVKIIEKDPAVCSRLFDQLPSAQIVCGDGAKQELLLEEGIADMDGFVGLTGSDEENILMSFFAKSRNVTTVIPKINRSELAQIAMTLGLDTYVSPESAISNEVLRYARALNYSVGESVQELYKVMDDKVEVVRFSILADSKRLCGISLKDMQLKKDLLIGGILRDGKLIIPGGDDVILAGDSLIVVSNGRKISFPEEILK